MTLKSAPKRESQAAPVPLGAKPSSSRSWCRASTRFATSARRTWTGGPTPGGRPPGVLARLFGRRG